MPFLALLSPSAGAPPPPTKLTNPCYPSTAHAHRGGDRGFPVPSPARFNPSNTTFAQSWIDAARAADAGYTLLVASHCSGFLQWQSRVKLPDGSPYPYTVAQSYWKGGVGDVVDVGTPLTLDSPGRLPVLTRPLRVAIPIARRTTSTRPKRLGSRLGST